MSDPFRNLKHSMKQSVFNNMSFPEERKAAVKEMIRSKQLQKLSSWKEETLVALLDSLQHHEKDGYDISTYLISRNELSFQKREGQLYTLLHLLETKGVLASKWSEEKKYYSLTKKGKKLLATYKEHSSVSEISLTHLLEEASSR
ncbi:PadR family transcriptional regulator [Alkalihalobacterium bogoriense]|uniref:PadR family transcriptional regulator n=1 Tax=Alkalihalobacterium bogoriense TaxID=246272 RepID=UPI00047DFDFC|nr:PadR family transcriptional regulator [Alkalihalobacterium bogoriense]